MNIIQQPDLLSLSMNMKEFIVLSSETVSFVLHHGAEEVLSRRYEPGADGRLEIDVRDVIHSRLEYDLQETSSVYVQSRLVGEFTAHIDNMQVSFRVIRGGVDRLVDTPANFLTQNFLTWQPSVKAVTFHSPEFLTYYAASPCVARLKAYFDKSEFAEITLAECAEGNAYTIPLQYATVSGLLDHRLPSYYDVWVENLSGVRLTYIQRFHVGESRSIDEDWILFENSLGGLDTFRAYGELSLNVEHTHNVAEIDERSLEYRIDTERKYSKNTGHLDTEQSRWLLDFFPSERKYLYVGNYMRPIVVVESNVSAKVRKSPANYTFVFKFADARPLLNLPRTDVPAEMLNVTVPEVGSFTTPPRLSEFPRLPLSEGVLFPVQHPYSENWGTTTIGALTTLFREILAEYDFGNDTPPDPGIETPSGNVDAVLAMDVISNAPKTGHIDSGQTLRKGMSFTEFVKTLLFKPVTATLTGNISTGTDVEYGSSKGDITYTATRNGNGAMSKAYHEDSESNVLEFSAENNGVQTAVRHLTGIYTQRETYKATVVYRASKDGSLPAVTLTNTISVNVHRKWFAGVVDAVPTTSAQVRALSGNGFYRGAGTYKFSVGRWKTFVICVPVGTVIELTLTAYPGNFIEDTGVCSGPATISVEGAGGSQATDYQMWVIKTDGINDADTFTFKTN